jgi:hypothetical protein
LSLRANPPPKSIESRFNEPIKAEEEDYNESFDGVEENISEVSVKIPGTNSSII